MEGIEFSTKYLPDGKISQILKLRLDQALEHYKTAINTLERLSQDESLEFDFSLEDALVKDAYIVGGLLWGRNDSDIDLYLKTYNTNYKADRALKFMHFESFCKYNPKTDWVDLYLGKKGPSRDNFEGKPNYRITNQIRNLLMKHKLLRNGKKKN